jgi:hypothetical protein
VTPEIEPVPTPRNGAADLIALILEGREHDAAAHQQARTFLERLEEGNDISRAFAEAAGPRIESMTKGYSEISVELKMMGDEQRRLANGAERLELGIKRVGADLDLLRLSMRETAEQIGLVLRELGSMAKRFDSQHDQLVSLKTRQDVADEHNEQRFRANLRLHAEERHTINVAHPNVPDLRPPEEDTQVRQLLTQDKAQEIVEAQLTRHEHEKLSKRVQGWMDITQKVVIGILVGVVVTLVAWMLRKP